MISSEPALEVARKRQATEYAIREEFFNPPGVAMRDCNLIDLWLRGLGLIGLVVWRVASYELWTLQRLTLVTDAPTFPVGGEIKPLAPLFSP